MGLALIMWPQTCTLKRFPRGWAGCLFESSPTWLFLSFVLFLKVGEWCLDIKAAGGELCICVCVSVCLLGFIQEEMCWRASGACKANWSKAGESWLAELYFSTGSWEVRKCSRKGTGLGGRFRFSSPLWPIVWFLASHWRQQRGFFPCCWAPPAFWAAFFVFSHGTSSCLTLLI